MHVSFIPVFSRSFSAEVQEQRWLFSVSFSAEVQEQRWWWSFCYLSATPKGLRKNIISLSILAVVPFCIYPFPPKVTQCILIATFIQGGLSDLPLLLKNEKQYENKLHCFMKTFLITGSKKILNGNNSVIYWTYALAHPWQNEDAPNLQSGCCIPVRLEVSVFIFLEISGLVTGSIVDEGLTLCSDCLYNSSFPAREIHVQLKLWFLALGEWMNMVIMV